MLTKEEIKIIVANQIAKHGYSYDILGICKYRQNSQKSDVCKCGIGALINDELYDPCIENIGVTSAIMGANVGKATNEELALLWAIQSSNVDVNEHNNLLKEIQTKHDRAVSLNPHNRKLFIDGVLSL